MLHGLFDNPCGPQAAAYWTKAGNCSGDVRAPQIQPSSVRSSRAILNVLMQASQLETASPLQNAGLSRGVPLEKIVCDSHGIIVICNQQWSFCVPISGWIYKQAHFPHGRCMLVHSFASIARIKSLLS